jgi:hypothetical protein
MFLSILFSVFLSIGLVTVKYNNDKFEAQKIKYETDIYDFYVEHRSSRDLEKIRENKDIQYLGLSAEYATIMKSGDDFATLLEANDNYILSNTKLESGRLPKNDNEIVAERWVLKNFGVQTSVGNDISLDLKVDGKINEKTFKLVGITKDNPSAQAGGAMSIYKK